ncbi:BPI-like_protein [Hexamita inflata]|uniref:BPI-like protein n=1 Tax=Hexamita inflata TaxID=28002 RepID=A0AA86Q6D5_9EUKA|nr:BPI-like protein [Hexamita inflata]
MLVLTVIQQRHCELNFPRNLNIFDTAQFVSTKTAATSRYALCYVNDFIDYVYNIKIPNISVAVNFGIKFEFTMCDIKISNINIPDISIMLNNDEVVLNLINIDLEMTILKTILKSTVDQNSCPGHIIVENLFARAEYESLKIQLEGGNGFLLQSVINIIIDLIQDDISKTVKQIVVDQVVALINTVFEDGRIQKPYLNYENIIKDARYTSGVQIGNGYLSLLQSGYTYEKFNLQDEYMKRQYLNEKYITLNKFNGDIQFGVHVECFNNIYYIFHKYNNLYSTQMYQVTIAPQMVFMNTVAYIKIQVIINQSIVDVELLGTPIYDDRRDIEVGTLYFIYQQYQAASLDVNIDLLQIQKMVVDQMNFVSKNSGFQFSYTHLVDIRKMQYSIDPVEQIIRLIGDIPSGCGK